MLIKVNDYKANIYNIYKWKEFGLETNIIKRTYNSYEGISTINRICLYPIRLLENVTSILCVSWGIIHKKRNDLGSTT